MIKQLIQLAFIAYNEIYTSCGSINERAGTLVSVLMNQNLNHMLWNYACGTFRDVSHRIKMAKTQKCVYECSQE